MEHREFICVQDPAPQMERAAYEAVLSEVERALLAALEARGLLDRAQYARCADALAQRERGRR